MKCDGPSCPRCGYDLSGEVATWAEACPLRCRCSECGYGLEWDLVFRRQAGAAWWLFELDEIGPVRGFVRTVLEGLKPKRFWTAVRVEDWPRVKRLAGFFLVLALAVHVAIAALSGVIAAKRVWGPWIPQSWRAPPPPPPIPTYPMPQWLGPTVPPPAPPTDGERFVDAIRQGVAVAINPYATWPPGGWAHVSPLGPSFLAGAVALCLLPLTIAAARGILHEGRAKSAHFWRVWVYGWIGPAAIVLGSAWLLLWLIALGVVNRASLLPLNDEGFKVRIDPTIWIGPAMFAWAARWWYIAAAKYLKWERPLAVAVSACVASFFLVFGITLLWMGWDYVMAI